MTLTIKPLSEIDYSKWNDFCNQSDTAWFQHLTEWMDCLFHMTETIQQKSFAVFNNNEMVAAVPLLLDTSPMKVLQHGGCSTPYPAYKNEIINTKLHKKVEKLIFNEILNFDIDYCHFYVPPLCEDIVRKTMVINPLPKFGFQDTSLSTNIITLSGLDQNQLFNNFRKGTKSDIKTALKNNFYTEIYDSSSITEEMFNTYRKIHKEASGRQTRPSKTFEIQYKWIKSNLGFLTFVKQGDSYLGCNLIMTFKKKAYYGSGCILPKFEFEKGIGHLIQWDTIKYLFSLN